MAAIPRRAPLSDAIALLKRLGAPSFEVELRCARDAEALVRVSYDAGRPHLGARAPSDGLSLTDMTVALRTLDPAPATGALKTAASVLSEAIRWTGEAYAIERDTPETDDASVRLERLLYGVSDVCRVFARFLPVPMRLPKGVDEPNLRRDILTLLDAAPGRFMRAAGLLERLYPRGHHLRQLELVTYLNQLLYDGTLVTQVNDTSRFARSRVR